MDAVAVGCVGGALVASVLAVALGRRGRWAAAVLLVVASGVLLRANLGYRHWLSDWDERVHAVVARNLLEHPLEPTLVEHAFHDVPATDWLQTRVWLHKPPLALWTMAGAMAVFGEREVVLRLPSLAMAALGVWLTFLLARRFLGAGPALLAALLHAWHGRLSQTAAGLRATDHVDAQFVVWVELAALLGLWCADALRDDGPRASARGWLLAAACGLATGAAYLTKSAPALVALAVLGLALLHATRSWRLRLGAPALAAAVAALVALPWQLHVARAFPEAAAAYAGRNLRYFTEVVDGQGGPWWYYVADLAETFGPLAPLAVAVFLVAALRRPAWWCLAGWILIPYVLFSLAATKMTAYVYVAAPALFVGLAWFGAAPFRAGAPAGALRTVWRVAAVLVLAGFALDSAYRVHRPWRAPARTELWAEELRALGEVTRSLGPGPWALFDAPSPVDALFYVHETTPLGLSPAPLWIERARERGFRPAWYADPTDPEVARLAAEEEIVLVPHVPAVRDARALLARLPRLDGGELEIFNAREAARLEEYLERFVPVDVRPGVPDPGSEGIRAAAHEGRLVVLVPDAAARPDAPEGAIRVESARYAQPVGSEP